MMLEIRRCMLLENNRFSLARTKTQFLKLTGCRNSLFDPEKKSFLEGGGSWIPIL
jgi:hypothetical protein